MKLLRDIVWSKAGAALPMALVLMLGGALFVVPCLYLMSTSLNANRATESKNLEYYAADAGIEDAVWRIKADELPEWMLGNWGDEAYDHDPYGTGSGDDPAYPSLTVNGRPVEVSIEPLWPLEGLETPAPGQGREPHDSLVTVGDVIGESGGNGLYQISLVYDGSVGNLKIERIGCWIPNGINYVEGSSNLEAPGELYNCVPETSTHNGGTAITWDYSTAINYDDLPADGSKRVVTFEFTPNEIPQDSFSWMRTNRMDIYLSWDVDLKFYKIISKAVSPSGKYTTVTAVTTKKEFRMFGSAMPGDYEATGNTLMRNHDGDSSDKRERLYKTTRASIDGIPSVANVERIFLYWSGWKCKPWDLSGMTEQEIAALPEDKEVHKVRFRVKVGGDQMDWDLVTASVTQVLPNSDGGSPHGWSYSCFADVTDIVKGYFGEDFNGNATYKVKHHNVGNYNTNRRYPVYSWKSDHEDEDENLKYTRYPLGSPADGGQTDDGYEDDGDQDMWSYAGWSVIVIYTSPFTKGHSIHIYDELRYCDEYESLDFTITDFLAPDDVIEDPEAARLTCFVGEGDEIYSGDSIKVNGSYLSDPPTNWQNNVWNSLSNVIDEEDPIDGMDIDTYTVSGGSGIIQPGDVEAYVQLPTGVDSWNLIFMILSFRSEITVGSYTSYCIGGGG